MKTHEAGTTKKTRTRNDERRKVVQRRLKVCLGFCAIAASTFPMNPHEIDPTHRGSHAWMLMMVAYPGLEQALKQTAIIGGKNQLRCVRRVAEIFFRMEW